MWRRINNCKNWLEAGNDCHRECGAVLSGVWSMCIDVSEEPASSIIRVHDRVSGPLRNIGTFYRTTWCHVLGGDRVTWFSWNICTSAAQHIHNTVVVVSAMRTTCISWGHLGYCCCWCGCGCGCSYFCGWLWLLLFLWRMLRSKCFIRNSFEVPTSCFVTLTYAHKLFCNFFSSAKVNLNFRMNKRKIWEMCGAFSFFHPQFIAHYYLLPYHSTCMHYQKTQCCQLITL